ncbi:hypothetical protein M5D96_006715 [Drosophila gunungcola]|uniref:Uncharacterized protein n=1 Tax=Drosophila gunungcola TaxID=103775 RepID=A0A9Q0BQA2_9MUSC|nr:hypothetical protein M5D96_006715 [Drosophila gunungcola]
MFSRIVHFLIVFLFFCFFYIHFFSNKLFICIGLNHSYKYANLETELQERFPEYRVSSGFYNPTKAMTLSCILIVLSFIPMLFNGCYTKIWNLIAYIRRRQDAMLITGLLVGCTLLHLTEINAFEVSLEGSTIFSTKYPEKIPTVEQLVIIVQNYGTKIMLIRILFWVAMIVVTVKLENSMPA